jgi:hypothetical protein
MQVKDYIHVPTALTKGKEHSMNIWLDPRAGVDTVAAKRKIARHHQESSPCYPHTFMDET